MTRRLARRMAADCLGVQPLPTHITTDGAALTACARGHTVETPSGGGFGLRRDVCIRQSSPSPNPEAPRSSDFDPGKRTCHDFYRPSGARLLAKVEAACDGFRPLTPLQRHGHHSDGWPFHPADNTTCRVPAASLFFFKRTRTCGVSPPRFCSVGSWRSAAILTRVFQRKRVDDWRICRCRPVAFRLAHRPMNHRTVIEAVAKMANWATRRRRAQSIAFCTPLACPRRR